MTKEEYQKIKDGDEWRVFSILIYWFDQRIKDIDYKELVRCAQTLFWREKKAFQRQEKVDAVEIVGRIFELEPVLYNSKRSKQIKYAKN